MPTVRVAETSAPQSVEYVSANTGTGGGHTHAIETELVGTPPRVARQTKKSVNVVRFLWNLLFVTVGLLGFLGRRDYETWNALIARGVPTQASVYDKRIVSGKSTSYYLDYRFYTEQGSISGSESVSESTYDYTSMDDKLSLTYLPEAKISKWQLGEVSAQRRDRQTWCWVGGTAGAATLIGLILFAVYSTAKDQLRFLREGSATQGWVTSGKVIRGKYTTYRLYYAYGVGESSFTGMVDVDSKRYTQMTGGNPYFTILYDSAKPNRCIPYFNVTSAYLVAA